MAQWIWRFGDFEMYHHLLVQGRRRYNGANYPSVWKLYAPEPMVRFKKDVHLTAPGTIHIWANGPHRVLILPEISTGGYSMEEYIGASELELRAGEYSVIISVQNPQTFPALYVSGVIETDDTWDADDGTLDWTPAECSPLYTKPDDVPEIFAFERKTISPVSAEPVSLHGESGMLYDYGRELYASLRLTNLSGRDLCVCFGESREEALDPDRAEICERFSNLEQGCDLGLYDDGVAFRFLYLSETEAQPEVETLTQVVDQRAAFSCSEPVMTNVWNTAAYTFLLNDREFFLDGIKRDRWVWSADAYQSGFVNHYLFRDQATERRTLIALGGRLPVKQYINTIMDYSYFWIMAIWEYYMDYGDLRFLEQIMPQVRAVMQFCDGRRSADGYVRGQASDWVFIDWGEMDKSGALLGEQVLLATAMRNYARIIHVLADHNASCLVPEDTAFDWAAEAERLEAQIQQDFFDAELGAYVDCFESGNRHLSRQNNILALLYLHCGPEREALVQKNVLQNDAVPPITTPYFRFYEMRLACRSGQIDAIEDTICNYYGPMLEQGATTLYEEFDPKLDRVSNYAMYNRPYGKSLCHAWSSSPIYLLGRYRLGVKRTDVAWKTFEVSPVKGPFEIYDGTVPLPNGEVHVRMEGNTVTVSATCPGGTLVLGDKRIPLPGTGDGSSFHF